MRQEIAPFSIWLRCPCKARLCLQAQTVPQAGSMLAEISAARNRSPPLARRKNPSISFAAFRIQTSIEATSRVHDLSP
jgi:hypothetical protein